MNSKQFIGKLGEDKACDYLINKGYKILFRNYWKPWGELDIIAKAPLNILVFIEVKTMRQNGNELLPEDNLTAAKLKKLKRTAQLFAGFNENLIDPKAGWRIDLIAILLDKEIHHYENI